ncbi:MAG: phosphonate C-P lyase system protein PhnG [Pseudomonadota bacterium]
MSNAPDPAADTTSGPASKSTSGSGIDLAGGPTGDPLADRDSAPFDRRARLSVLAKAPAARLKALWARVDAPDYRMLRAPETGTAMIRGRAGGTGAPFNLGEVTVTRCSVALADGIAGHGYVQGRDREAAQIVALADALAQAGAAETIDSLLTAPLQREAAVAARIRAEKAAATKVAFFTLARGEDP